MASGVPQASTESAGSSAVWNGAQTSVSWQGLNWALKYPDAATLRRLATLKRLSRQAGTAAANYGH